MRSTILVILFQAIVTIVNAQYSRYIIELTDKKGTSHSLANPQTYLSLETIARRKQFNIAIDSTDLPVSKVYLDSIAKAGIVYNSKANGKLSVQLLSMDGHVHLFPIQRKRLCQL